MPDEIEATPEGNDDPTPDVTPDEVDDPGSTPEVETETETPSDPPANVTPESWANLQKKYPTADEATLRQIVGDSWWQQTKELSRLARENEELRKSKAAPAEETKPEPEVPIPEIQELDADLQRLDNREKTLKTDVSKLFVDLNNLNIEIVKLQGQLEIATESEKESIASKLEVKEARYAAIYTSWEVKDNALADTVRERARIQKERTWFESLHKDDKARKQKEQDSVKATVASLPNDVNGFIEISFKELGFPADPDLREEARDIAREHIMNHLGKIDPATPLSEIDFPTKVKRRIERFMKANKISARQTLQVESQRRAALHASPTVRPATPAKPGDPAHKGPTPMEIARKNMIAAFSRGAKRA